MIGNYMQYMEKQNYSPKILHILYMTNNSHSLLLYQYHEGI